MAKEGDKTASQSACEGLMQGALPSPTGVADEVECRGNGEDDREQDLVGLMVSYQAGELAAFERLYSLVAPRLERYLTTSVFGDGSVQDLTQETFLALHRSRHTYLPPLPVLPWVFGIARHVLGRHRRTIRKRSRLEERSLSEGDFETEFVGATAKLDEHDLAAALARIPAPRREAWVLHHVHGFSFRQIAAQCSISVAAAKLRSSRALRALRTSLGARVRG
jgi:RNA polymerase sigma-70 factor (ECF subfamily)